MKIKFVIIKKELAEETSQKTLDSLKGEAYVEITSKSEEAAAINCIVKESTLLEGVTHICMLPNGSTLSDNFMTHAVNYYEEGVVLLPIVEWCEEIDGEDNFKAFLNSYVYQSALTEELGIVDLKFAKQQLDNTLYGAIIPMEILKENPLKEKFQYYFHNEYICRLASKGIDILGIPKYCVKLKTDYALKDVDNATKTKYFNAVLDTFATADDLEIA